MRPCVYLLVFMLICGCATQTTYITPPRQEETLPEKEQVTEEKAEKILQEIAKQKTLEEQAREAEAEYYYNIALNYYRNNLFKEAKDAIQKAINLYPEHREARKLLDDINKMLGQEVRELPQEESLRQMKLKIQQTVHEINYLLVQADAFMRDKKYKEAISYLEDASIKIKAIQVQVPEISDLLADVEGRIKECKERYEAFKKMEEQKKLKEIEEEMKLKEEATKYELRKTLSDMFRNAVSLFELKRYDECIAQCERILQIAPTFTQARDLKIDAQKADVDALQRKITEEKIERWKQMWVESIESVIPVADVLMAPPHDVWTKIISARKPVGIVQEEEEEELRMVADIVSRLETEKITFVRENINLHDFARELSRETGLTIQIDPELAPDPAWDTPSSITLYDVIIKNVLKIFLDKYNMDYRITPERVILITTRERAKKTVIRIYSLKDIIIPMVKFTTKYLPWLDPTAEAQQVWGYEEEEPEEEEVWEIKKIEDLIKKNFAKGTWEQQPEIYNLQYYEDPALLIVSHTPEVHKQLEDFFEKIRMFKSLMITVIARFVAAYDDWLEDVGVDIINRPAGPGFDFRRSTRTDLTEWTGEIGPGLVSEEWARRELFDIRAQTFNTFFAVSALGEAEERGHLSLSRRLQNLGGLGLQYIWLGEVQLQTVLRAVAKDTEAEVVHTARATVSNNQVTYVSWVTQYAYISDYDIGTGGLFSAYEAKISYFHEGVVLRLRPNVSYDKKYVTLELRPSVVELIEYRGGRRMVISDQLIQGVRRELVIQAPHIFVQQAAATIVVPDRGTVVLAAFKDLYRRQLKADVPLLGDIPVISFLFGRRAKAQENRRLYILITPYIIDLMQEIKKF